MPLVTGLSFGSGLLTAAGSGWSAPCQASLGAQTLGFWALGISTMGALVTGPRLRQVIADLEALEDGSASLPGRDDPALWVQVMPLIVPGDEASGLSLVARF